MPAILIKDVPRELHQQLKRRAESNHRSLTRETLAIIEAALRDASARPTLEEVRRWRLRGTRHLTNTLIRRARIQGRA